MNTNAMIPKIQRGLLLAFGLVLVFNIINSTETYERISVSATSIERSMIWSYDVNDYNNNGNQDFFIAGHDRDDRVWLNHNDTVYIPDVFTFPNYTDRHGCDSADVDNDGWIDIFCSVGAGKGSGSGNNELYMGSPKGFRQVFNHGAEDGQGSGRNVAFLNINGDDYPDLYVTNRLWRRKASNEKSINRVFLNDQKGGFYEALSHPLAANIGFSCLAVSDWDNDGLDDIALCGKQDGIYFSSRGHVNDISRVLTDNKNTRWRTVYPFDYNEDELKDLLVISKGKGKLSVFINNGPDQVWTERLLFSPQNYLSDVTIGDINADGNNDIYLALKNTMKCISEESVQDKVLIGPEFKQSISVESDLRCVNSVFWLDKGIVVRTNANHSSIGDIELLKFEN